MSTPSTSAGTITHDVAARLIGVTPAELTALVKDGQVRRADKNAYSLPVLVQDYIGHLNAEAVRPETHPKQTETAAHLDLSDRSIREWEVKLGMQGAQYTLTEFRIAYIRSLRESASGREAVGDLDLATERARLAKEQADKIAMQNEVSRRELAPVTLIEEVLAKVGRQIAGVLESIPVQLKRRSSLSGDDLDYITAEIVKARNLAAAIKVEALEIEFAEEATIDV